MLRERAKWPSAAGRVNKTEKKSWGLMTWTSLVMITQILLAED